MCMWWSAADWSAELNSVGWEVAEAGLALPLLPSAWAPAQSARAGQTDLRLSCIQ